MMSPDEIAKLIPAEKAHFRSPIPTQAISSDEFCLESRLLSKKNLRVV